VLRYVQHLARDLDATLVPVLSWLSPCGDLADRRTPNEELRRLWAQDARQRLQDTLNLAWGEPPADLPVRPAIQRGQAGLVLVDAACRPGDLLVVGPAAGAPCPGSRAAGSAATAWLTPAAPPDRPAAPARQGNAP
jgi:hypothetical protein